MVKLQDHDGVDNGYSKKINSQPCHLGSFLLSHSKPLLNDVILAIDCFKNNKIYYSDTDSICIHKKNYDVLKTKGLIGIESSSRVKTIMAMLALFTDRFYVQK